MSEDLPQPTGGIGDLLRIIGRGAELLGPLLSRGTAVDPLDALRAQHLQLQIDEMSRGSTVALQVPTMGSMIDRDERQDHLFIGDRGGGKTAAAAYLAQLYQHSGREVAAIGLTDHASEKLGIPHMIKSRFQRATNMVLLIDEAGLTVGKTARQNTELRSMLALARHRNLSLIWVAQHTAMLNVEILRFGATIWFKRIDPVAQLFDRDELKPILSAVVALQAQHPWLAEPSGVLALHQGGWHATKNDLPIGWSDTVSKQFAQADPSARPHDHN